MTVPAFQFRSSNLSEAASPARRPSLSINATRAASRSRAAGSADSDACSSATSGALNPRGGGGPAGAYIDTTCSCRGAEISRVLHIQRSSARTALMRTCTERGRWAAARSSMKALTASAVRDTHAPAPTDHTSGRTWEQ